jgi:hypothetical protein
VGNPSLVAKGQGQHTPDVELESGSNLKSFKTTVTAFAGASAAVATAPGISMAHAVRKNTTIIL